MQLAITDYPCSKLYDSTQKILSHAKNHPLGSQSRLLKANSSRREENKKFKNVAKKQTKGPHDNTSKGTFEENKLLPSLSQRDILTHESVADDDEILVKSQIRLTTERGKTESVEPATDREREKIRQIINSKSFSHMSIM